MISIDIIELILKYFFIFNFTFYYSLIFTGGLFYSDVRGKKRVFNKNNIVYDKARVLCYVVWLTLSFIAFADLGDLVFINARPQDYYLKEVRQMIWDYRSQILYMIETLDFWIRFKKKWRKNIIIKKKGKFRKFVEDIGKKLKSFYLKVIKVKNTTLYKKIYYIFFLW